MDVSVDNRIDIESVGAVEVAVGNAADAVVADDHALDITVTKKEYKIVGDEVYIAKLYDDAPQWMKDLVQLVVDNTMGTESAMLRNDLIGQLNRFATSYVPLNTYTQSILDLSNANTAMHATLETLNSNFNDGLDTANSQIINLNLTKASKDEVVTSVIETLTAQLATPTSKLGATIGNLQQTIIDGDSANADSVTTLMSTLEGEVDARASAIETISTYVGIDEAGASTSTGLSAYLEGSDGTIGGADSQVANSIAIVGGVPTSKWQYNSALVVNGATYNSGFGLSNSAGTGIGSEFWIDASRFKFTNSAKTGSTAPFTIDASGATPQITFNGRVSFSNVSGAPGGSGNLLYNSAPALGNEQKGWQIGWYNTSIAPALGTGFDSWRPSGGGSVYATITGAPTIGGAFDVLQTNKVPVVGGSWYDASAYTSSHRCTSYVTIAWFDSNDTYINEVGGSQVAIAGGGALINWGRTMLFAQAPANAAKASFYVRSIVNGTDPYCFVAFAYLGKSVVGQTVHSDWSEGTSAGATRTGELTNDAGFTTLSAVASQGYVLPAGVAYAINTNTTTIDGAKITTGSIAADKIVANSITGDMLYGGVIYNIGGTPSNYTMKIDLNTGEIHIR